MASTDTPDKGTVEPAKRRERIVCEPALDESWQLEYSVHRLNAVLASDAKASFGQELDPIIAKMAQEQGETPKDILLEHLLGVPTWQPAPTFATLSAGDWASAQLDLSVYPSQVSSFALWRRHGLHCSTESSLIEKNKTFCLCFGRRSTKSERRCISRLVVHPGCLGMHLERNHRRGQSIIVFFLPRMPHRYMHG
jgi:hypothetical protein